MTQIDVVMMACYLVGHSNEVGVAYICSKQTISNLENFVDCELLRAHLE